MKNIIKTLMLTNAENKNAFRSILATMFTVAMQHDKNKIIFSFTHPHFFL